MGERCVPSLIVIGTAINQLETKVSLKTICCLRQTCNVAASEEIVGERCVLNLIVINNTVNKSESKVSTHCLRLFVVVYKVEML